MASYSFELQHLTPDQRQRSFDLALRGLIFALRVAIPFRFRPVPSLQMYSLGIAQDGYFPNPAAGVPGHLFQNSAEMPAHAFNCRLLVQLHHIVDPNPDIPCTLTLGLE